MDFFEHIEAYKNGTLSDDERNAFEAAMLTDPALKQAVEDHDVAMDIIGSILESEVRMVLEEGNSAEKIEEQKSSRGESKEEKDVPVRKINWMRWAAAAAVVFVVGWWGVDKLERNDSELYVLVYADPTWPTERGSDNTPTSKTISKYFNGGRAVAKSELISRTDNESRYWLSEIYLKEMKFDSTLIYLPEVSMKQNKLKRDRINYLKILSLYFSGHKEEAQSVIKNLPRDTDSFYYELYKNL